MDRLLSCAGCLVLRQPQYVNIHQNRLFHVISVTLKKNHYQILGVTHKATAKEIRDAFVKRSKEVHPDKNPNDPENHNKFVRVAKAYHVLKQQSTRNRYDHSLAHRVHLHERMAKHQSHHAQHHYQEDFSERRSDYESYDYHQQFWKEYHEDVGTQPYRKDATKQVLVMCVFLLLGGWLSFFLAIRYSQWRRDHMDRISKANHEDYEKQKAKASMYTLEERLEQVRIKTQKAKNKIAGVEDFTESKNTTS